jgi:hypothetical protein
MSKKIITAGAGISVLAESLRDHTHVRAAFAADETARRQQVEKIVGVDARSSSSKIPGPAGLGIQELLLRLLFR